MAKSKTAHLVPYQFRPAAAPAPIVVTRTRTVHAKPKKGKHHRRGYGPQLSPPHLLTYVLGGFIAGFAEKQFGASLPSIPLLGKKGTLTIALYFLSKTARFALLRDAAIAAAGISGYELGSTGKITGDDGIASQV